MTERKTILFLLVRAFSAAVNVLSIAVFTRLAGPVDYGEYLIIFAWATIVFGFATQWMKFAYFGVYRGGSRSDEFLLSFGVLLSSAIGIVLLFTLLVAALGLISFAFSLPVFALVCGMTIYEGAFEASRTRQDNKVMIAAMLSRALLMLVLGTLVLIHAESAQNLAYAIAVAHLLAALPSLYSFRGSDMRSARRQTALRIIGYGWPLALSFGVIAIGQSVDRLLLAHLAGPEKMAPYGVLADFLRQTYMVAGEAIALALITTAKHLLNEKDHAGSQAVMKKAFTACLSASLFGALFFVFLGEEVLSLLLGPEFRQDAIAAMPLLAVAFAFMTIRVFYFSQVIYFTSATLLELVSSLIFVSVSALCVVLLVPTQGSVGAATALLLANVVTTVFLIIAGRKRYALPIDWNGGAFIVVLALGTGIIAWLLDKTNFSEPARAGAQLAAFGVSAAILLLRFRFWAMGDAAPQR